MTTRDSDGQQPPRGATRREHAEFAYDLLLGVGGSGVRGWSWVGRGCGWQFGHMGGAMPACAGVAGPSSAALSAARARARVRHLVGRIGGLLYCGGTSSRAALFAALDGTAVAVQEANPVPTDTATGDTRHRVSPAAVTRIAGPDRPA